ncbi:MAG: carbapenem self-resistance protein CarG family protein [Terasakiella sp.]|uniref:carbapenem self-resistance protein CarG family protein n=1 Tax=unclassified Terasakiella TaxID=2614952 RepID=UPI003B00B374
MSRVFQFVFIATALICSTAAYARMEAVPLKYGSNPIDLDGDGKTEQVIKTWRENFNAHGYYGYLFLEERESYKGQITSTITVLAPDKGLHRDMARSNEGVDCTVTDFTLIRTDNDPALVLLRSSRPITDGYSGNYPVTFEFYKLTRNEEGLPGDPYRYWKWYKSITSKQKYCDVHKAMNAEILQ